MKAKRELQERVNELRKDFEEEKQNTLDITLEMTRQYKAMQEELIDKITGLERTIEDLKDKLGTFRTG